MISFSTVKLVIWDLDETLWSGTLSDNETIRINPRFVQFIQDSLDRGIVHSICSKNDFDMAKAQLCSLGLWELFVFPSIDWSAKGQRLLGIIRDMNLRAPNVLFVDDNVSNINEAKYYCPGIQACTPEDLLRETDAIYRIEKIDPSRPRLAQYRLLEEKVQSQKTFPSNEAFLMSCDVRVAFHDDCASNIDRIHDLILRSNQLNYTKFRQEKADLLADLALPDTKAAYITVTDAFGDYGIVGFYMIVKGSVKHFLFSCRTLGMLVEQYVYMQIGCPPIQVVGDVITTLNSTDTPQWINAKPSADSKSQTKGSVKDQNLLFKGPCDISQIFSFIEESGNVTTEFTYVNDRGISVEGHNHTAQLVTALCASADEKALMIRDNPWLDENMLEAASWQRADAIVFSLLTDGNLGVYQHRETGWQIALCEKHYDLTDARNHEGYISKQFFTSQINFTKSSLDDFSGKYRYVSNAQGDLTVRNLDVLYSKKQDHAKLILLLGSEIPFKGSTQDSYQGRELFHKTLNDKIKAWASGKENVCLIEISKYITSQKDYTDTINHFQKKVYYHLAQDILAILNNGQDEMNVKSKVYLYRASLKAFARRMKKKLLGRMHGSF